MSDRTFFGVIMGETALAAALYSHRLGDKSLWLDETFSVQYARHPLHVLPRLFLHQELNMGGYHLLLHFWMGVAGTSETAVRSLSVVAAVACVPAIVAVGTRLLGRRAGLAAGLLLAVNGFVLEYAQEARGYAWLLLAAIVSTVLFLDLLEAPTAWRWVTYGAACACGVSFHFFGVFIPMVHAAAAACLRWRTIPWRRVLACSVGALSLGGAAVWVVEHSAARSRNTWQTRPTRAEVLRLFPTLGTGRSASVTSLFAIELLLAIGGLVVVLLPVGQGVGRLGRRNRLKVEAFLFAWLLIPVAAAVAVSAFKPIFVVRYLIIVVPALVLIVAAGLDSLASLIPRPYSGWAAALAVAGLAVGARSIDLGWYHALPREAWRPMYEELASTSRPGDVALMQDSGITSRGDVAGCIAGYYQSRLAIPASVVFVQALDASGLPSTVSIVNYIVTHHTRIWLQLTTAGVPAATDLAARGQALANREASILGFGLKPVLASSWPRQSGRDWLFLLERPLQS